jgi:hypothetical protein
VVATSKLIIMVGTKMASNDCNEYATSKLLHQGNCANDVGKYTRQFDIIINNFEE